MKYIIQTKYHGATDDEGSHITATCAAGRKSIPYPHELSGSECHKEAASALCRHLGWRHLDIEEVTLPDGNTGFVAKSNK